MMLPRTIRHIKYRLHLAKLCTSAFLLYDKKTDKMVRPNNYEIFQMASGFAFGGCFFVFVQALQIYFKLSHNDIPDEPGFSIDENAERNNMYAFATMVIGWGEIGVVLSLSGVSLRGLQQMNNFVYVFNEMFAFSEKVDKMLKERGIEMDRKHKLAAIKLDVLVSMTSTFSVILGFLIMITCLHPLEPTHVIIKDWLELEWEWHPKLAPFLLLFQVAIQGCVNNVVTYGLLAEVYTFIASTMLDDLAVEGIHKRRGPRTVLETRYFGNMEDREICEIYRTQRYLNIRVNEIFSSILISFHQVGMLACFAIMMFFFVKFQHVISEVGPIAFAVVIGSMLTPLAICYYQSNFFGELVNISDGFRESGLAIVPRKTMFRRFIVGTQTYFVEEAYPFFHYNKGTFLEFCAAGLDYAINLMFW